MKGNFDGKGSYSNYFDTPLFMMHFLRRALPDRLALDSIDSSPASIGRKPPPPLIHLVSGTPMLTQATPARTVAVDLLE